jgi:EAL domain-containing protein (putative c-di-GMP-specific phosphodiesterase class I)
LDNKIFAKYLDSVFNQLNEYCSTLGPKTFQLGILSVDNLAIIEQNFGTQIEGYLEEKLRAIFAKNSRHPVMLQKIDYSSYLFILMYENHKSLIRFVESIFENINAKHNAIYNSGVFFMTKIGITEYTGDLDIRKLFNQAQTALFNCRYEKDYNYSFYHTSLIAIQKHVNYTDLLAVFVEAMETNRLALEFQPIVNSQTRKNESYECLLRIVDSNGYKLSAFAHIKAAEEYGFISNIDKLILVKAIDMLDKHDDLNLCINISGATITDSDWVELAQKLFYKKDLYHRLTLEITETAIVKNFKSANFFIKILRELGCKISIDDFGSGYNSYAQLKNITADSVKIGDEYIKDILDNKNNALFTEALINLAKNLNLKIIAEYVDNEKVADVLTEMKIDYLQGSLFQNKNF